MQKRTTMAAPQKCDLLIRADVAVTQDNDRRILTDVGVSVLDGLVLEVGNYADLEKVTLLGSAWIFPAKCSCPAWSTDTPICR